MGKPQICPRCAQAFEDFRRNVLLYRVVLTTRSKILTDTEESAADSTQICHHLNDLFDLLSQSEHNSGFGSDF